MADDKVDELKQRQEEERETLQQRHAVEIEKLHLWVEAEILNACHQLPPDPSDNTRARLAHNSSACDYFLKQRYGKDVCCGKNCGVSFIFSFTVVLTCWQISGKTVCITIAQIFIDRFKSQAPHDTDLVRTFLSEKVCI